MFLSGLVFHCFVFVGMAGRRSVLHDVGMLAVVNCCLVVTCTILTPDVNTVRQVAIEKKGNICVYESFVFKRMQTSFLAGKSSGH